MDWQKIVEDYSQLGNAYPNAKKFAEALRSNIAQNVPTQAELENPEAMSQWSQAAALNAPMGLTLKNLNAGLIEKYLKEGKLSPEEMAQYEANALAMETPNLQKYNLENANLQGGTPESRSGALGFSDTNMYHGTASDFPEFNLFEGGAVSRSPVGKLGISLADNPSLADEFALLAQKKVGDQKGNAGANVLPLVHRINRGASMLLHDDALNSEVFGAIVDAQKQGIDAIKMNNYTTPSGKKLGPAYLIQHPNQIRSRFAAFDPLRAASPSLLAGGALGSLLLNQEYNKDK